MAEAAPVNGVGPTAVPSKSKVDFSEVQETVSRLAAHKGVKAVLILNQRGDILTQTGNRGVVGNPKLLKQTLDAASRFIRSIPSGDGSGMGEEEDEEEYMDGNYNTHSINNNNNIINGEDPNDLHGSNTTTSATESHTNNEDPPTTQVDASNPHANTTTTARTSSPCNGSNLENLSFVRIRSRREEILVAPKNQYVLVVIQDPNLAPL